jgi:hypothetical protein
MNKGHGVIFRIESNTQANMFFFVDAEPMGGIRNTPTNMLGNDKWWC